MVSHISDNLNERSTSSGNRRYQTLLTHLIFKKPVTVSRCSLLHHANSPHAILSKKTTGKKWLVKTYSSFDSLSLLSCVYITEIFSFVLFCFLNRSSYLSKEWLPRIKSLFSFPCFRIFVFLLYLIMKL